MKYIIRKGTQEHDDIVKIGLASMTEEIKKELVSLYFYTLEKKLKVKQ